MIYGGTSEHYSHSWLVNLGCQAYFKSKILMTTSESKENNYYMKVDSYFTTIMKVHFCDRITHTQHWI